MATNDRALVSMAEQFNGLPMDDLIGGPLMAVAEANSHMAGSQVRFLLDLCFFHEKDSETNREIYRPIMIEMELVRGVLVPQDPESEAPHQAEIKEVHTKFNLPLITIIPINSLAVDEASISFDMEVKSSYSDVQTEETEESLGASSSFEAKVGYGPFSAKITGSVAYDSKSSSAREQHYEKSNSAQYSVQVHAAQLPMPEGVKSIIETFTKSITPLEMPA
ncbi:DUF2589 domain-containing protein [Halomonas sp. 328]|uniref:DUF2589 domain-containing protein n=1 Tax=Halomonas sp. 328 TaxID=2776704 RepID=UPI0018A778D6|nr:DUF2589 domain-containing protein [Halomonas sp. 328]MBF8221890.1 DUF2589 domain-containing protein [Halomonas sp. 328]